MHVHDRLSWIRLGFAVLLVIAILLSMPGALLEGTLASMGPAQDRLDQVASQEADSVVVSASADTYVLENQPSANYGASRELQVGLNPHGTAYILFDVSGLPDPVENATLRLWSANDTDRAPSVWMSSNIMWAESEMTWDTRPALESAAAIGVEAVEAGSWLEFNVTGLVRGNGTYTIAVVPNSEIGVAFNSREAAENQPQLVIQRAEYAPPSQSVTPEAGDEQAPVLLAAGDIAACDYEEDEQTARILDANSGIVAPLGDLVQNDGTAEEYEECYDPTWGRHKERTMPVPGNHDYVQEGAEGYYDYWGDRAGVAGEGWYTYEIGEWQVFALNSNMDQLDHDKQYEWLREELEASEAACTLAYWHHPRFSSSERHGNNDWISPFWEMLYENGADIVLNGHDHVYERFAPQNPDQEADPEFGIRQFTVATGGVPQRGFGATQPNSEVRMTGVHGVLRLELQPGGYTWEFLSVEGQVFTDAGSGVCHGAPGVADEDEGTPETGQRPVTWIAVISDRAVAIGKIRRIAR